MTAPDRIALGFPATRWMVDRPESFAFDRRGGAFPEWVAIAGAAAAVRRSFRPNDVDEDCGRKLTVAVRATCGS